MSQRTQPKISIQISISRKCFRGRRVEEWSAAQTASKTHNKSIWRKSSSRWV